MLLLRLTGIKIPTLPLAYWKGCFSFLGHIHLGQVTDNLSLDYRGLGLCALHGIAKISAVVPVEPSRKKKNRNKILSKEKVALLFSGELIEDLGFLSPNSA